MNSYPYPSPPSLGHHGQAHTLSATEEAVAFVALLSRQRSSSFDNSFGPEAKRARSNTPPAAAPIEPVSLQRWLQSVSTPPLDTAAATTNSVPTTAALSHSLSDLEYSHAWSCLPPSSASEAATGFEGFTTATGAESFDYPSQQRLNGVQTNFHPTPVTTPQPQSFTSSVTNAAVGRPVNLRSTTAPVAPSRSLAEIKLAAGQVGAQFGAEIEMRARGEQEQQRQAHASSQQVQRSSTDPGLKVGAGNVPNKDRFVAGLVGASVLAIESIWGAVPTDPSTISSDSGVLPLHWFVKEVLRRSRTSCSTLQLALYYLHKSRREIREVVSRADLTRDEYCRLEKQLTAERDAHALGDSYPSPPLSPLADPQHHLVVDPQQRFAALVETQNSPILCGRRMFLASLIAASKFLQDRNYSNRAWARISGLPVGEINVNERSFLNMMKFQLHLGSSDFVKCEAASQDSLGLGSRLHANSSSASSLTPSSSTSPLLLVGTERLAALTTQGAALEHAAAASSSTTRVGLGLTRSQTDYPTEQLPLEGPLRTSRPALTSATRSHSEAEVSSKQALLARLAERRLAAQANAQASVYAKPPVIAQQQTASPAASSSGSTSSEDEDDTSSSASSASSSARKVRGMPIRRAAASAVAQRGIPLVRSGSQSSSSMGSSRAWSTGMEVDQNSASAAVAGQGQGQGWGRWRVGASTGVAAH